MAGVERSSRFSVKAAKHVLTAAVFENDLDLQPRITNGPFRRLPSSWSCLATSSLPVPLSPASDHERKWKIHVILPTTLPPQRDRADYNRYRRYAGKFAKASGLAAITSRGGNGSNAPTLAISPGSKGSHHNGLTPSAGRDRSWHLCGSRGVGCRGGLSLRWRF